MKLFRRNLPTENKGLCTFRELPTQTAALWFLYLMFVVFHNQSQVERVVLVLLVLLVCDGCVGCGGCDGCGACGGCEERIFYRKLSSKIHVYFKLIFYLK